MEILKLFLMMVLLVVMHIERNECFDGLPEQASYDNSCKVMDSCENKAWSSSTPSSEQPPNDLDSVSSTSSFQRFTSFRLVFQVSLALMTLSWALF